MKKYSNVIGFLGASGAGKSYLADIASEISGIPVFKHEELWHQVFDVPVIKDYLAQNGITDTSDRRYILEFLISSEMFPVAIKLVEEKFKAKIENGEPVITAWQRLPLFDVTKQFGEICLIKSDDDMRLNVVAKRDGVSKSKAAKRISLEYDFTKFKFTKEFFNDCKTIPDGFIEYAQSLKELF